MISVLYCQLCLDKQLFITELNLGSMKSADAFLKEYQYRSDIDHSDCSTSLLSTVRGQKETLPSCSTSNVSDISKNVPFQFSNSLTFNELPIPVNPSEEKSSPLPCNNCINMEATLMLLHRKLERIDQQLQQNSTMLQQALEKNSSVVNRQPFEGCSDFDALLSLEKKVSNDDEFAAFVNTFGVLGGRDVQECTRRVISRIVNHKLSLQLNWIGCGEKKSIQDFPHILQLICASVRKCVSFKDVPHFVIEDSIKRWLRYASDRQGGRNKRQKSH